RAVELDRIFDGRERLAERGVAPPIPHEKGRLPHVEKRGRTAPRPRGSQRNLSAWAARVQETRLGDVAAGAGHLAGFAFEPERAGISVVGVVEQRAGKPLVEKELLTEKSGCRIVGITVGRILRWRRQLRGRESSQLPTDLRWQRGRPAGRVFFWGGRWRGRWRCRAADGREYRRRQQRRTACHLAASKNSSMLPTTSGL